MNVIPIVFEKTSKEKRKKAELYQRQKISSASQELEEQGYSFSNFKVLEILDILLKKLYQVVRM